jgi:hypothetical protein
MISVTIERITVLKDGIETHDMTTGKIGKVDKWIRTILYTQIFDDKDFDINKVVSCANERSTT